MGNKIEFNTGRHYSPEGQIIKAEEFNGPYEQFDFMDPSQEDQYILFEDVTRNIKGKITFCRLQEDAIMHYYDNGQYDPA